MDNAELSDKPDESRGGGGGEGRDEGVDCGELASQSGHTVLLHTSCCGKLTEISLCLYQRKSNSELLWLLRIIHRS